MNGCMANVVHHPRSKLSCLLRRSSVAAARSEGRTELDIAMSEIQYRLRKTRRLHYTPDLDCALGLYEVAYAAEEARRELSYRTVRLNKKRRS